MGESRSPPQQATGLKEIDLSAKDAKDAKDAKESEVPDVPSRWLALFASFAFFADKDTAFPIVEGLMHE